MNRDQTDKTTNKYILLDLIGTGGMAEVYRCKLSGQQGFEKIIVIKKLFPHIARDKGIVTNFIDEAKLAALLQHENIISIYDFGEIDGSFFIAMEYLFGKDLHTLMQSARIMDLPMAPELALFVAAKICKGMEYAHSLKDLQSRPLNIIHRDLSPHNVFLTYDGNVKIIDFGIAKAELYDNRTRTGVVKGKVSYMSPEQIGGEDIDQRSDIFSVGILLYEMLSGVKMYSGNTAALISKCVQVDYRELKYITPDLHTGIYDILNKALEKDRAKRYQSCASMYADIDDCLFAMKKRIDSRILKEYVRNVLRDEYKDEKKRFSTGHIHISKSKKLADSELTRIESYQQTDSSINNKTFHEDIQEDTDKDLSVIHYSLFRYWKWPVMCVVVVGLLVIIYQFNAATTQEDSHEEIVPITSTESEQQVEFHTGKEYVKVEEEPIPESESAPEPEPVPEQLSVPEPVPVVLEPAPEPIVRQLSALQVKIDGLLVKAQNAFKANRLTQPKDNSAYIFFKKILELDPMNNEARKGIHRIGEQYAELAEQALWEEKYTEALDFVESGLSVYPNNRWLLALQKKINNALLKDNK